MRDLYSGSFLGTVYCPFAIACLITVAIVSWSMFRSLQYLDCSHTDTDFCPLLALQPRQQRAMFSLVMILASLIICSQLGADLLDISLAVNGFPQYTQILSRSRTSSSSHLGIFHLFAIVASSLLLKIRGAAYTLKARWQARSVALRLTIAATASLPYLRQTKNRAYCSVKLD